MTRILQVIAQMGIGGAETIAVELARLGDAPGSASAIASSGGARLDEAVALGAHHYDLPLAGRRVSGLWSATAACRKALTHFGPDVTIAHNVGATLTTAIARQTQLRPAPLITTFHGVAGTDYRRAAQILDRAPTRLVAVSSSILARLRASGLRRTDGVVIRNAVPTPILPSKAEARSMLHLDQASPTALCLARMVEQKRHDVLIRAWALLPDHATLLLAGSGELRPRHERLAAELGVAEHVRFLGERTDVEVLLAASNVSTLSSDWEGLPMAVIESMAAGLPVVATDVDGLVEAVHNGEGRLVPTNDPQALADALAKYLFDPDARDAAGAAAKRGMQSRHNLDHMLDAYADLVCTTSLNSRSSARRLMRVKAKP